MKKFLSKLKSMFWGDEPFNQKHSTLFLIYVVISTLMVILSLILAQFSMPFFGLKVEGLDIFVTVSIIAYPVTYVVSDVISECYGFSASIRTVWLTFAANFTFVLFLIIGCLLPVADQYKDIQDALIRLMSFGFLRDGQTLGALGVIFASFLAFIAGRWTDSMVFAFLKKKAKNKESKKLFTLRAVVSSVLGEIVDTAIFYPLFYLALGQYGTIIKSGTQVLCIFLTFAALKLLYEIVFLPVTMLVVKKTKQYEAKNK